MEKRFIDDYFASDLADYYAAVSDEQIFLLEEAQQAIKKGLQHCLRDKFGQALTEFQTARKLFLKAGDVIEADVISLHFIAYCYHNLNQKKEAYNLFRKVNDFCDKRNYKWFLLMNLDWLIGSEQTLEYKSFTEVKDIYESLLEKSEKIKDSYTTQKFLLSLIRKSYFVRQEATTLGYLHKLFQFSKQPNISDRQKFRNFDKAVPILALSRFQSFSKEVVLESVSLAEPMSDPLFVIGSQINAGIVHTQSEDFETAEEWLNAAMNNAEDLEEKSKQLVLAKIFLQNGHLEEKKNDLEKAAEFYDKSLKVSEKLNNPSLLYEIKKSRLAVYQKTGNDAEVEKDIYSTLKSAEKYREKILDEQDRNSFFDNEQDIYDVAVEHKLRANQIEDAYHYGEVSNSRSLLDWLLRGASVSADNQKIKIILDGSGEPLEIGEIRKKIPSGVQLLQFSVLKNKVLIWIISKERFSMVSSEISSDGLKKEVENYLAAVKEKNPAHENSKRLYNLLITPALKYLEKDKEICIIPDKILFHLPFSSLISPNGNYFLEDFELFYSPSANVFIYSTEKAKKFTNTENEEILSVGNPAFDIEVFPNLKNLPEAEIEAQTVARNYNESNVLIDKKATKISFQKIYRNFDVIHFAGHYIVQPDYPLSSKLIMAKDSDDGEHSFLTNADLLSVKLPRTKLIVLSACQTGIENYSDGEGLIGLSHTFLSLGVPVIVASQWKIDSDASAELMKNFHYFRRQKNLSINKALRMAQLELLKTPNGRFQSPYFWAGFAVFGGYAAY